MPLQLVDDLFRRESAHLVAALVRALGPAHLALAEDMVHEALISAMHAWRFEVPADPVAWLLRVAKNRAIDVLRRDRRLEPEAADDRAVDLALSAEADTENQLAMMFAICDDGLTIETHVTLVLRFACGFSTAEIARVLVCEVSTIERRLHRGRATLRALGRLEVPEDVRRRQPSVEHALYALFSEGYQGSDVDNPLAPALCSDALRFAEMLCTAATATATATNLDARSLHALAALFCFNAARLDTRLDDDGVLVRLADQDRARWDRDLVARGIEHLGASAHGEAFTRWHLEAGIAFEHVSAPTLDDTRWDHIVAYYDALQAHYPSPLVACNRAVAIGELRGPLEGLAILDALADEPRLVRYSYYWAARGDLASRARAAGARPHLERAIQLATSRAERESYERRIAHLWPSS